ncbi:MAG: hypothetical protein FRX49_11263 [Trebouxia sp. A1-2]|nr:MAG: hypothetical protein FRX49_11263 [Trebouxia sp. A1-2]
MSNGIQAATLKQPTIQLGLFQTYERLMRVRWRGGHPKFRNEAVSADYIKEAFRPERLRKHHDHLHTTNCGRAKGGGHVFILRDTTCILMVAHVVHLVIPFTDEKQRASMLHHGGCDKH